MERIHKLVQIAAALSVAAFFSVLTFIAWQARTIPLHVNGVLTRAEGVESKINATAVNMDKATATWADSAKVQADAVTGLVADAHGALAQASGAIGGIQTTVGEFGGTATALTGEITALQTTTESIPPMVGDARLAIQGLPPLEASLTSASTHLDGVIAGDSLKKTLDGFAVTSTNLAASTTDFQTRFHALLFPPPCKNFSCKLGQALGDGIRYGPPLAQTAYWGASLLGRAIPVKIQH